MRLDGQHVDVDRQLIAIGDDVLARTRRDLDRLASQPQADRRARRRGVGEEEADGHGHALHFPGRLEMQLHDEVAARLEPPLRALGRRMRRLSRRPSEQLPFGIARVALHAAGIAGLGIARVELTRRPRAVDAEVGVVHDPRVARMKFDGADVARRGHRNRHHEGAEHIGAVGRHLIRLGHAHDEIGRAQLPAVAPVRLRRQRRRDRPRARRPRSTAAATAARASPRRRSL